MELSVNVDQIVREAQAHPAMQGANIREALAKTGVLGDIPHTVETVMRWRPLLARLEADLSMASAILSWTSAHAAGAARREEIDLAEKRVLQLRAEAQGRLHELYNAVRVSPAALPAGWVYDDRIGQYVDPRDARTGALPVDRDAFLRL